MTLEKIGLWGAVVVALGLGYFGLAQPPASPQFGANTTSPINGCLEFGAGGATLCVMSQRMKNASTTCSFKPEIASSTLIRGTATVNNWFGGTHSVEFGKATTAFATTTQLGVVNALATGETIIASTSQNVVYQDSPYSFSSGEYFNVKVGSSSPTISGNCTALFMSL